MSNQLELFTDEPFSLRLTIKDALRIFWDNYWSHLASAKSTAAHFERIKMFFSKYYLDTISKADIERFRRYLKEMGYADATINKSQMILSRMFHKFEEYRDGGFVGGEDFKRIQLPMKNPASLVPKVNERQFARKFQITPEIKKILCSCSSDEDFYEIIDGLWWTQLRPSDFFKFTNENVDVNNRVIEGIQSKTITTRNPSGVRYRIAIPDEKLPIILRRMSETKPGTALFRRKNFQKRWQKTRALAAKIDPNIAKAQARDIRGGAASHLLQEGFDPETVRKTLGHTTLRMLPNYDKRPEENVIRATSVLAKN